MQQSIKYAAPYKIYKTNSAAQFVTIRPRVKDGRIEKEGAILLEAARGLGNKKYDWQNKISFAIGMSDLKAIFGNIKNPPKLIHQTPNSNLIKTLEFTPGEGKYEGTFLMKLSQKDTESNKHHSISVPLQTGEKELLFRMMDKYTLSMLGWV